MLKNALQWILWIAKLPSMPSKRLKRILRFNSISYLYSACMCAVPSMCLRTCVCEFACVYCVCVCVCMRISYATCIRVRARVGVCVYCVCVRNTCAMTGSSRGWKLDEQAMNQHKNTHQKKLKIRYNSKNHRKLSSFFTLKNILGSSPPLCIAAIKISC